jgi:hypothetical protein
MNLVVLWALYSRRHWFLRASAVLAAFLVILPTRAYEVVCFFAWYVGFLAAAILAARFVQRCRQWRSSPKKTSQPLLPRFRVLDALLDMMLVGAVVAMAMYVAARFLDTKTGMPPFWPLADIGTARFLFGYCTATAGVSALVVLLHCWLLLRANLSFRWLALFVPVYLLLVFIGTGFVWTTAD